MTEAVVTIVNGCIKLTVLVIAQLLASFTITEYVPALKFVALYVVWAGLELQL